MKDMKKEWLLELRERKEGFAAILPTEGEYVWLGGREAEKVLSLTVFTKDEQGWHTPIVHVFGDGDVELQFVAKEGEGVILQNERDTIFLGENNIGHSFSEIRITVHTLEGIRLIHAGEHGCTVRSFDIILYEDFEEMVEMAMEEELN